LIIAKRKTSFFFHYFLSLSFSLSILFVQTSHTCTLETAVLSEEKKENFKVRQRRQVEIYIHVDAQ
jgi:hypothetical protein